VRERERRRQWALTAIEIERNERISSQFLNALTSTNWFHETISTYSDDYELVCPYYKLGCRASCRRASVAEHLRECTFAVEMVDQEQMDTGQYEVVCLFSKLGCRFSGNLASVKKHMLTCFQGGKSQELELEERRALKEHVIFECEEERMRRLHSPTSSRKLSVRQKLVPRYDAEEQALTHVDENHGKKDSTPACIDFPDSNTSRLDEYRDMCFSIHTVIQLQFQIVQRALHESALQLFLYARTINQNRRSAQDMLLIILNDAVSKVLPSSFVEAYGSHVSGLSTIASSDLDVVVCFKEDSVYRQSLVERRGVIPLLQTLAIYLPIVMSGSIRLEKLILHTKVPVLKAVATIWSTEENKYLEVMLDISLESPVHTGIATTELMCTLVNSIPPLGPAVYIIKEFLSKNGLGNSYLGGISTYGICLLTLLPILKRLRESKLKVDRLIESSIVSGGVKDSTRAAFQSNIHVTKRREWGHLIALKLLGVEESALPILETIFPLDERIIGEIIQETLEMLDDMLACKRGFSVRDGGFTFDLDTKKTDEAHPHANDPFVIEDPVDVMNNVARNAYNIQQLQVVCHDALEKIRQAAVRPRTRQKHNVDVCTICYLVTSADKDSASSIVSSPSSNYLSDPSTMREKVLRYQHAVSSRKPVRSRTICSCVNSGSSLGRNSFALKPSKLDENSNNAEGSLLYEVSNTLLLLLLSLTYNIVCVTLFV